MKNTSLKLITIIFFLSFSSFSQTTIVLQPGPTKGKDASTNSRSYSVNVNNGSTPAFQARCWTWGGTPGCIRSFIQFDLSSIPDSSIINSAFLTLTHNETTDVPNGHSSASGSNTGYLRRISSTWNEFSITHNNQPTTVTTNQVILPTSTSILQDYTINVKALVQDMVKDSANSFGFMMRLITEQHYRALLFASSDYPDSTRWPKLEISYSPPESLGQNNLRLNNLIKVFPNPTSNYVTLDFGNGESSVYDLKLLNNYGQVVKVISGIYTKKIKLDLNELSNGIYYIQIATEGKENGYKKIIVLK
jgi:hypothetical protein